MTKPTSDDDKLAVARSARRERAEQRDNRVRAMRRASAELQHLLGSRLPPYFIEPVRAALPPDPEEGE